MIDHEIQRARELLAAIVVVTIAISGTGAVSAAGQFIEDDPVALRGTLYDDDVAALKNSGAEQFSILDVADNPELTFIDAARCDAEFKQEPQDEKLTYSAALCWSSEYWAQGIAGSGESQRADVKARNLVVVSWHSEGESEHGRITVADIDAGAFRNVPLVTADFQPLLTHAGGLTWVGDFLYLADTDGMVAFNLDNFFRDPVDGVVKLVASETWEMSTSTFRISTLSAVQTDEGSSLVAANYDTLIGSPVNVYQWALDADNRLVADDAGVAQSNLHFAAEGINRVQGVEVIGSKYLFTESGSDTLLTVDSGTNEYAAYKLPHYNTQDLYSDEDRNMIWSMTEGPATERDEARLAAGQTDRLKHSSWMTYLFAFTINGA